MTQETAKFSNECPRGTIAAYLDGELAAQDEFDLEMHFAVCEICSGELSGQKKLLHVLDLALEAEKEIKLPENFTKIIVANAESNVSGLRRPCERSKALFICLALFLAVVLALGSETEAVLSAFGKFFEQVLVVIGFIGHLAFDIAVGITVVLRALSSQLVYKSVFVSILLIAVCGFCVFAFSRLVFRHQRI